MKNNAPGGFIFSKYIRDLCIFSTFSIFVLQWYSSTVCAHGGYRVLFVLQMIETLGQGAGGAAGRGYVVVVSNFFEVVFVLSFVLAERRIFGEEAGTSSGSSGRKEEPLLSGTT